MHEMGDAPFVLGISGVPGAGKTTLIGQLLRRYSRSHAVYYDHYQTITQMGAAQIRDWFERGGDPNEFDLSALVGELRRRMQVRPGERRHSLLLFETPFGRLHRATGAFIDVLVWVDTPLDAALSRALLASINDAQRNGAPDAASEFLAWQRQYLTNYELVRGMYLAQRNMIVPTADLVLDGSLPVDISSDAITEKLTARGIEP
jgi:uridine kinase